MSDTNGLRPGMGLTWLELIALLSPPTDDGIKAIPVEMRFASPTDAKRLEGLSDEEVLAALLSNCEGPSRQRQAAHPSVP
jgi:hypothetical protein